MSEILPPASEKGDMPPPPPIQRYPFVSVTLGMIIGIGLCTVGFVRLGGMAGSMDDETSAILPFAAGFYFLLLAVVLSAMHPRPPAPRLRLPRIVLSVGLPACTCIAIAIVYISTRPYNHAFLGFWDSLDAEGMYVWNMLALHSVWLIALCIFAWSWPVTRHRIKSRRARLARASQGTEPENMPRTDRE